MGQVERSLLISLRRLYVAAHMRMTRHQCPVCEQNPYSLIQVKAWPALRSMLSALESRPCALRRHHVHGVGRAGGILNVIFMGPCLDYGFLHRNARRS